MLLPVSPKEAVVPLSLLWLLHGEFLRNRFMKGIRSWLDDLKIRGILGQTGSATGLGLYPSYTLISTGGLILNNTLSADCFFEDDRKSGTDLGTFRHVKLWFRCKGVKQPFEFYR